MSGKLTIKNLRIFFLTVGEDSTFDSLKAIREHTHIPYDLTIWYDTCGRGFDYKFFERLTPYANDVIVSTTNHYQCKTLGYALLYLSYDYLMFVPSDCIVKDGYLDRFQFALANTEQVGCVGCARVDGHPEFKPDFDMVKNSKLFRPDGVMLFNKDAVLDVGSISPSFQRYGLHLQEWTERALAKGWNMVACSEIADEVGGMHSGRDMNPGLQEQIAEGTRTYLKIRDTEYKDFKWWDHCYGEREKEACLK